MTPEERKAYLRRRTAKAVQTRDQKGLGKRQVLNLNQLPAGKALKEWSGPKTGPAEKDINAIDIIPWEVTQDWYQNLRSVSGLATGVPVGALDYKLEIPVHRNIGDEGVDMICLRLAFGKKCPVCEDLQIEYDKAKAEKRDIDAKVRQALAPSWRNFYNIFDLDDQDKGIQQWMNASYHCFEKYILEAADLSEGEFETFADLENGRTIEFSARIKQLGKSEFPEATKVSFIEREPYDDSIISETISFDALVHIPTYDEVNAIYLGMSNNDVDTNENENENENVETPSSSEKSSRYRRKNTREETKEEINTEQKCSKGHIFGKDNNKYPECQECDEDEFQKCAAIAEGEDATTVVESASPTPTRRMPTRRAPRTTSRESAPSRQRSRIRR